ncbi:MAG: glycosyltransferase family 2 protein [Candidatus Hydrogenedentes bacterium]|nr:glycosyltransferase family 2 protein [Candidatus Hydrogenedentota bacterium]
MCASIDISVVVCTYNRADMLRVALDSLCRLETEGLFSYEIIVVDDASTDDTGSVLEAHAASAPVSIRSIRGSGKGVAAARNTGIHEARGAYIAFFDDDQIAEPSWLIELWQTLQDSGAACVGGARTLDLPTDQLASLPRIIRLYLGEIPVETEVRPCGRADLLCTGTVLMERRVFQAAGRFDASLTQGGEDTEFFARVRRAGLPCWYTPRSIVRHMVPEYRLQESYLMWAAIRGGECFAHRDALEWGASRRLAAACARVAHAVLVHGAMIAVASLSGARQEALARKCQIYRACAYARVTGRLAVRGSAHAVCGSAIEFRSERNLFSKSGQ